MRRNERHAFQASVILHITALVLLALPILLRAILPREEAVVFELVNQPAAAAPQPQPQPQPPEPIDLPDVPELPPIPQPPQPQPSPPQPSPPQPQPPQPAISSYQEFIREHGRPEPRQQVPRTPRNVEVQPIDTARIKQQLNELLSKSPERERVQQMSPAEQNALAQYAARLNARLNTKWAKPPGLSGSQLVCEAIFDVSASGVISNVRLNPSSGNAAFDASVKTAFRQVVSAGPTPSGEGHTFTLRFRMVE